MDKPWFNLDPNNFEERWWTHSSIYDEETAKIQKNQKDVRCLLIIQDSNLMGHEYWRCSTWYKNDSNRYYHIIYGNNEWPFDVSLVDMKEGDIITKDNLKFMVFYTKYGSPCQLNFLKILERID